MSISRHAQSLLKTLLADDDPSNKVIIDGNFGVDSLLALMYAIDSQCSIMAVTCVSGNTSVDNAVTNVNRLLQLCNRKDIPVHRGVELPLFEEDTKLDNFYGKDGMGNKASAFPTGETTVPPEHASLALLQLSKQHRRKITLLALGPMTNLVVAHMLDPRFSDNFRQIYVVGGTLTEGTTQLNFSTDQKSAKIFLPDSKCPVTVIPKETFDKSALSMKAYEELIQADSNRARFVKQISEQVITERYFKSDDPGYILGSLLASIAFFNPESVAKRSQQEIEALKRRQYERPRPARKTVTVVLDFKMDKVRELFGKMLQAE